MKKYNKILWALALILPCFIGIALAGPPTPPPPSGPGSGVPLDGGAVVLLIAGAAYGVKKIKERRNKEQK